MYTCATFLLLALALFWDPADAQNVFRNGVKVLFSSSSHTQHVRTLLRKTTSGVAGIVTCPQRRMFLQTLPVTAMQSSTTLNLNIDASRAFQTVDGFGYTLTGGSAEHLMKMSATTRRRILLELFGDIGISTIRISVGASDLDPDPYSLAEVSGDSELAHFSMSRELRYKIPLLKEIKRINPRIQLLASPWSAPYWMKDNHYTSGGSLLHDMFPVYAQYLVKYLKAMAAQGLTIHSMTIQNEPLNPHNNPSMYMSSYDHGVFVKNHLAPALRNANLNTKLILYDHNADEPDYPTDLLDDPAVKNVVSGSAFHLYGGTIDALTRVHNQHPNRNVYFTEQYTSSDGQFEGDFMWHARHIWIGSLENWSKMVLEFNLSSNPSLTPRTPGGCTKCLGAITISGSSVTKRNVAYYLAAQVAPFVPPGSVRVGSSWSGGDASHIDQVAFQLPNGKTTVLLANQYWEDIAIRIGGKQVTLPSRSFVTVQF